MRTAAPSRLVARHEARAWLHAERPFLVLLTTAAALRVAVLLGFPPIMWFYGDSDGYLGVALQPSPYDVRAVGYSFFLMALQPLHSLAAVAAVQHLIGLLVGAGVYLLLRRLSVPGWLALLAAAPVLLDAYQLQLEQLLMAETVALGLAAVGVGLLVWTDRPSPAACAWAGLFLALATLTRSVALVLVVPALGYLLVRRAGAGRVLLTALAVAVPLHLYASWFAAEHGERGLNASDGFFLYGRVMTWASCDGLDVPAQQAQLCDERPPEQRPGLEFYMWEPESPAYRLPGTRLEQNVVLRDFAVQVIRQQPLGYARAVLGDLGRLLDPVRHRYPSVFTYRNYVFSTSPRALLPGALVDARTYQEGGDGRTQPVPVLADALAAYQKVVYLPSPLYAGAAVLALVGIARGRRTGPSDRRRAVAGLLVVGGSGQILLPIVVQGFDYRYELPALPLLPVAAALGLQLLLERRSARGPAPPEPAPTRQEAGSSSRGTA